MNDLSAAAAGPAMPSWQVLVDRYADDASDCTDEHLVDAKPQAFDGFSSEDEQDALEAAVWAEVYAGVPWSCNVAILRSHQRCLCLHLCAWRWCRLACSSYCVTTTAYAETFKYLRIASTE